MQVNSLTSSADFAMWFQLHKVANRIVPFCKAQATACGCSWDMRAHRAERGLSSRQIHPESCEGHRSVASAASDPGRALPGSSHDDSGARLQEEG